MDRDLFLSNIAGRLGRERIAAAPERDLRGVPEFYRDAPYGKDAGAQDRVEQFQTELERIGGHVSVAGSAAEAGGALRDLLDRLAPQTIITWDRREFTGWEIDWLWDERGAVSFSVAEQDGPAAADWLRETARHADVGITLADFAIANTGTIALATTPRRARSVSLLPTVHIALIRESQFVDRLGQTFDTISGGSAAGTPSSVHFISGPSRSSDIENDLTIGVHGPVALYVILARTS